MSTITTLQIWRDTGFTEGCLDMPSKTSSLGTATFTFGTLNVSRDRMFSEVQVKAPYEDLYDCSYLKATYDFNNGYDVVVYGWIDKVICSSDTESSPMTRILWHIDYWRTYLSKAVFGNGMVKRRPLLKGAEGAITDVLPPQSYPYRFMTFKESTSLTPHDYWWVLITMSYKSNVSESESYVQIVTAVFPVSTSNPSTGLPVGTGTAPSLNDVESGSWDEVLGIDPNNIFSVFLSPVAPNSYSAGTLSGWGPLKLGKKYVFTSGDMRTYTSQLPSEISSTDTETYLIADFDGNVIGSLPWGYPVKQYSYRLIVDVTSAYLQLRFDGKQSNATGTSFTIPLIPVALSANGWSSYVYSGARQADIDQMRVSTQQSLESGLLGSASSAVQGAASGAMLGAIGGPIGMLGGAAIGAITSAVSGAMTTGIEYSVANKYNAQFQDISDYRAANQANGLIMSGSGFDALYNGNDAIMMLKMEKDEYSVTQRSEDIDIYGVHVSEPKDSCQSLVNAGGPLQISNLTVSGSIPVEAKDYFKTVFARGVRIV